MTNDKYATADTERIIEKVLSFPEETSQGLNGVHEKIFNTIQKAGEGHQEVSC